MSFYDEVNAKTYDEIDEDVKMMDIDEIDSELREKLKEIKECHEFSEEWLREHDEDAPDSDWVENEEVIAELEDEISDLIVAYREKDLNAFENNFPEIAETLNYY
jgi:hypothetical protein